MSVTTTTVRPRKPPAPAEVAAARERATRRRVGIIWALLILNVLTFYPKTWSGQPLLIPIPSAVGKLMTQGSLPLALLLALTVNRRLTIRPNVFMCLVSLHRRRGHRRPAWKPGTSAPSTAPSGCSCSSSRCGC